MPRKPVKAPGPHVHWLTQTQAARLLEVEPSVIYGLVRQKTLKRIPIPGSSYALISRMDVLAIKRQMALAQEVS